MVNPRIPPHDEHAEKSVLGSILTDAEAIFSVVDTLSPEYFYFETNSKIFAAMRELGDQGEPIDLITLTAKLKKNRTLKQIGGTAYLSELLNIVPTAGNIKNYAKIVEEAFVKRKNQLRRRICR